MHQLARVVALVLVAAGGAALADDAQKPGSGAAGERKAGAAEKPKTEKPAKPEPAPAMAAPNTLDQALRILQLRRVDVDFHDMAFDEIVSFIAKVGRVNTLVSPEYQKKSDGALPAITLKLRNVSLRQLAEIVAKQAGSKMVLRDGILQFTTPEDARGTPVLRVFSISDLTFRIRNFPGPDIRLHTGGGAQIVQEEETDQPQPFDDPQAVLDLVKKFTGEGTWDDDAVSISADGNKLVVKQYAEVLKEISAFLAVLRAAK